MCYFDKVWGIYRENYTAPYKEANRIKLVKTRCGYLHSAHGYQTPIQAEVEYLRKHASEPKAA
jgi:hypothetical protein